MFKIFPIITEKVERLDTLKSEDDYEEIQELTEFLLEDD
jgi:hypothetical protein